MKRSGWISHLSCSVIMEEGVTYITRAARMGAVVRFLKFGRRCEWCGGDTGLVVGDSTFTGAGVVKRMFKGGNVRSGEPFRVLCSGCDAKLQGNDKFTFDYLSDYIYCNNRDAITDLRNV